MVNYGGCGVFAESVFPYLVELGLDPVIRVYGNGGGSLTVARQNLQHRRTRSMDDYHANDISFAHVACEVWIDGCDYIVDSEGVHDPEEFIGRWAYPQEGELTHFETLEISRKRRGWNPMFERGWIKPIKQMLREGFAAQFGIAVERSYVRAYS